MRGRVALDEMLVPLRQARRDWGRVAREVEVIVAGADSARLCARLLPDQARAGRGEGKARARTYLVAFSHEHSVVEARRIFRRAQADSALLVWIRPLQGGYVIDPAYLPTMRRPFLASLKGRVSSGPLPADRIARIAEVLQRGLCTTSLPLLWMECRQVRGETWLRQRVAWDCIPAENALPGLAIDRFLSAGTRRALGRGRPLPRAFAGGELLALPDAFHPAFAAEVRRSLDRIRRWPLTEEFSNGFHYRHHNVYDMQRFTPEMLTCFLIISNLGTKRWMEQLCGQDCRATPRISASWYRRGDHSLPHTDFGDRRVVAFVWHLTRAWNPLWGGSLFWAGSGSMLDPAFNTLYLFRTTVASWHMVTQVTRQAGGRRLALNGWWRSTKPVVAQARPVGAKVRARALAALGGHRAR